MPGKLIKYEWKSTCKMGCLMLGGIALVTLFGWLAFQTPMWKSMSTSHFAFGWLDIFSFLTLMMYVLLLVGINYAILIYLGVHFYKTMYTDEGYLTHTLPVTEHQILGCKVLVSGLWMLFEVLSVIVSVFILGMTMFSSILPERVTLTQLWREIISEIAKMLNAIGFEAFGWLAELVILLLLSPFTAVIILFGAISLGQLFSRHRVLMSILCYIGIMVAESLISTLIRSFVFTLDDYVDAIVDLNFGVNLVLAVILYIVSYFVNSRKLNLL